MKQTKKTSGTFFEFQAVVTENPTYYLNSEMMRNLVEEKSRDLTAAIVGSYNSALVGASPEILRNQLHWALSGNYEDGQKNFDIAIR